MDKEPAQMPEQHTKKIFKVIFFNKYICLTEKFINYYNMTQRNCYLVLTPNFSVKDNTNRKGLKLRVIGSKPPSNRKSYTRNYIQYKVDNFKFVI